MPLRSLLLAACLAAAPLPVLAQAAETSLVQVFADWYGRHPIGSTVAPSQTRPVDAARLGLPALPTGQRYVEFDGMIAKVDAAWKLLGLVRRAPTTEAAAPAPEAPAATAGATATANAEVNVTVVTGDAASEGQPDGSRVLTIAEAEAQGIRIPRGHQPAAGTCRLWVPGTPPGRQPRGAVECGLDDLPPGAVLIRG
jgi:hypothetical protein